MKTLKLILNHKIDLALIGLSIWGLIAGIKADAPTITSGMLLFCIGYIINSIRYKVWLIKNGFEEFLKEKQ